MREPDRVGKALNILWRFYALSADKSSVFCRECRLFFETRRVCTAHSRITHAASCNTRLQLASELVAAGLSLADPLEEQMYEEWRRLQDRILGGMF